MHADLLLDEGRGPARFQAFLGRGRGTRTSTVCPVKGLRISIAAVSGGDADRTLADDGGITAARAIAHSW